jgi:hypothetical protein
MSQENVDLVHDLAEAVNQRCSRDHFVTIRAENPHGD